MSTPISAQPKIHGTSMSTPVSLPKDTQGPDVVTTLHASGTVRSASARPKLAQACIHYKDAVRDAGQHLASQSLKPNTSVKSFASISQHSAQDEMRAGRTRFTAVSQLDLRSETIATLSGEIMEMPLDQDQKNMVGSFLRGKSAGCKLVSQLLQAEFREPAQKIVGNMCTEFESGLKAAGRAPTVADLDQILVKTFQTMLDEMGKVTVSDNFRAVVAGLEMAIDANATGTCARLPQDQHANIHQSAGMLKQGIVKALFLRTLVPHFGEMVRSNNPDRDKKVVAFDSFFNQNPATQVAGMTMMKMSALLLTKINGASGDKQNDLGNTFPQLLQTFKASSLPDLSKLGH